MTTAGTGPTTGSRHIRHFLSPSTRHRALLCVGIGLFNVVGLVGDVLSPRLLERQPVLLLSLSPRSAYLVAVAHDMPFAVFFGVAVLRLCAADPLHFMLGRSTGPAAGSAVRRMRVLRRVARQAPPSASPVWLLGIVGSPTAKSMCAAGAAGLPGRGVAAANLAGTAGRVLVIWSAGRALPEAGRMLSSVARWVAVPGCLSMIVAGALLYRRRGNEAPPIDDS